MVYVNNIISKDKKSINQNFVEMERVRRKRSTNKTNKKRKHRKHSMPKENNECRRTELYVDFGELNWQDWIMAPGKL